MRSASVFVGLCDLVLLGGALPKFPVMDVVSYHFYHKMTGVLSSTLVAFLFNNFDALNSTAELSDLVTLESCCYL